MLDHLSCDRLLRRPIHHLDARTHRAGLERLAREVALSGDPDLAALHDELAGYPTPDGAPHVRGDEIAVPLRIRTDAGELAFVSTVATFGTAVDITVAELSIESFFHADAMTAAALR